MAYYPINAPSLCCVVMFWTKKPTVKPVRTPSNAVDPAKNDQDPQKEISKSKDSCACEKYFVEIDAKLSTILGKIDGQKGGRPPKTQVKDDVLSETNAYTVYKDGKIVYK